MATAYNQSYAEGNILEADGCKLVTMMYRKASQSLAQAREFLAQGDIRARSRAITKASEIVSELALSLDHNAGGELSKNLVELYDYIQHLMQKGNAEQADAPLAEAQQLINTLLEAWEQIEAQGSGSLQFAQAIPSEAGQEHVPVDYCG